MRPDALSGWRESGRLAAGPVRRGDGPLVIVCGALHGNEPAGIAAGLQVHEAVASGDVPFDGALAVVAGNLGALRAGTRFLDRDLNRHWQPDALERLAVRNPLERSREDREQLDLVALFDALVSAQALGRPVVFLDLHTTSGEAPPFVVVPESADTVDLARHTSLPVILDLHRYIDGPILTWWHAGGHVALGIEGGLHDDPEAERALEDAIWLVLAGAGCVDRADLPGRLCARLGSPPHRLPAVSRVVHRHGVVPASGFRMEPGFRSFDAVRAGLCLATDRTGPIRAPCEGMIFLPLYQDQGSDGFFVIRTEVR